MIRRTALVLVAAALLAPAALAQETKAEADNWTARIQKALEQKVTFKLTDVKVDGALALIQKASGVTIIVDPDIKGIAASTKVTLTVADMPAENALGLVLRLSGLRYILKDRAIFVSTSSRLVAELLVGDSGGGGVEESRPMTAADALVATSGRRGLGNDIPALGDPLATIYDRPWRLPERSYRDRRTGLMQFPAPPVWIASPYEGGPATRFTTSPYFLKPEYLAEFYYGDRATRGRSAQREMVAKLAVMLRANPDWTAKEILKQLEMLEATGM